MQSGEAAFIMNWPYVLSAMKAADKKVADDLGYTKVPEFKSGEPARATLGGMDEDLAADSGQDMHGEGTQTNAMLDAAANVRAGQEANLWVDTEKMAIFDVETGANLTAESKGAHART